MTKKLLEALVVVIVLSMVVQSAMQMIRPYVPWILVGGFVYLVGTRVYERSKNW